jgi:hypothetical protein
MQVFHKQPTERLDYDVDFSQFFGDADTDGFDNTTTVTATIDVVGAGHLLTDGVIKVGNPSRLVKVWLKAGVDGTTYKVTLLCSSSSNGRIVEQDFKVKVRAI